MLYLLYGEDSFTRDEQVEALKRKMRQLELGDLNLDSFSGNDYTLADVISACETVPFLAEKRMVIAHGLLARLSRESSGRRMARPRSAGSRSSSGRARGRGSGASAANGEATAETDLDRFLAFCQRLPPFTHLVLVEDAPPPEAVLAALPANNRFVREFPRLDERGVARWLRERVKRHGGRIEEEAVATLIELVGDDLRRLDQEVAKLVAYRDGAPIRREDVRHLVHGQDADVFALLDAIGAGDPAAALTTLRQLGAQGQDVHALLPQLASHLRRVLIVGELLARRRPLAEAAAHGVSLAPRYLEKLRAQAQRLPPEQVVDALHRLAEADSAIKSGRADPEATMEVLVAEIASRGGR